MTKPDLTVSVVICAYTHDRWIDLQNAIQSIQDQSVQPAEIILVVDHNATLYTLAQNAFQNVKVIENQEGRGLSGARNTGVAHSKGQIIAFLDEDAIAASDWIENLLRGYGDPHVVGVGGEVKPDWAVTPPDWLPEEFHWVVGCSYKGLPESCAPVRNPIGCNMSFWRDALINATGFRNGIGRIGVIPMGCEETELTIRVRQQNPSSIYLYQPTAVVHHKVPEWRLRWGYFIRRCYSEGISKALITHYVGHGDGLSSERNYVRNTLPRGVLSGIRETIAQHRPSGIKRAAAIFVGLAFTTLGYLVGKLKGLIPTSLSAVEAPNSLSHLQES